MGENTVSEMISKDALRSYLVHYQLLSGKDKLTGDEGAKGEVAGNGNTHENTIRFIAN